MSSQSILLPALLGGAALIIAIFQVSPRKKAIKECIRIAAELKAASLRTEGDCEAMDKFTLFSMIVEKHFLTYDEVKVQSFAYVLHTASTAAQLAYAGDHGMLKVVERFFNDYKLKYQPRQPEPLNQHLAVMQP